VLVLRVPTTTFFTCGSSSVRIARELPLTRSADLSAGRLRQRPDPLRRRRHRFASLAEATEAVKQSLAAIRYRVKIHGLRVTVSR
jgi:hypothetical protein